ncbi:hypothetical protein [Brevundimonas sp. GCM10030266]|uniref:hypothetical protein n=1 Tax=Brevundimonas sp. GCM10030266 TaxID=3273386 RepID=UPI0036226879
MSFSATLAALALLHGGPIQDAPASQPPAAQTAGDPSQLSEVVVRGERVAKEELTAYITEIGGGPPRRLMARWNRPICIGTANVRRDYAEPFIDHIAQVALNVGVAVDGPGCRANMLVIFTNDGAGLAAALAEDSPRSFIPAEHRGPQLTPADLEAFIASDRPVRWWHLSQDVSESTGQPVQMVTVVTPPPDGQEYEVPQVVVDRMSRLGGGMRADLQQGIVIVDTSKIGDTSSSALADYTAMVILSQIDPETRAAGFPSILSLFSEPPGSDTLTEWDWSYLRSLYRTPTGRPSRRFQEREIAAEMQRQFDLDARRPEARR